MDIKSRYNEYRVGAMFVKPEKATVEDLNAYVRVVRSGSGERVWQLMIDCRALAGKLMAHEELSKLIHKDSNDFILVLNLEHPKFDGRVIIGGYENKTYAVYKRSSKLNEKDFFKRLETWIKRFLYEIQPMEHLLNYGRRERYGLLPNENGNLAYVVISLSSYGDERKQFGQPYTESTWSSEV